MSASVARNAVNSMNSPIPSKAASYQSRRISRTPIAIPATSSIVPAPAKIDPTSLHVLSVAVRRTSTHRSTLPSQPTIRGERNDRVMTRPIATMTTASRIDPAADVVAATAGGGHARRFSPIVRLGSPACSAFATDPMPRSFTEGTLLKHGAGPRPRHLRTGAGDGDTVGGRRDRPRPDRAAMPRSAAMPAPAEVDGNARAPAALVHDLHPHATRP